MESLLTGLKVLDLTRGMAGAVATMLLGDNGANVIKLEPPEGDFLRHQLPHHVWNRNKRSALCDLKTDAGKALFWKLAESADIIIESNRPGVSDRLGIGYKAVQAKFPGTIYVSISGFGDDDVNRDLPGYEGIVDAYMGMQSEQVGFRDGPHFNVLPVGSYGAAVLAAGGALAALRLRNLTGQGQHIKTSLVDGMLHLLTMNWGWAEKDPTPPPFNAPSVKPNITRRHLMTFGILPAGDGKFMQMHSGQPGRYFKAMEIFGIADKIERVPPHLEKSAPMSDEDKAFLAEEVPRLLKTKPRAEWVKIFEDADISCMVVDPPGMMFNDPQVLHDKTAVDVDDPVLGKIKMVGPVLKCPEAPPAIRRPAPRLGEHNAEITRDGWGASSNSAATKVTPTAAPGSIKHPLQGVKIVDFGSYFAGPYASRVVCDLGADVIKIEPPSGDTLRPTATAFRAAQRGKRAIVLDMKAPESKPILEKLLRWADVVTHNFRPGVAERLGLGYEDVCKFNPKMVYLHSTGFGGSGPRSQQGAFAPLVAGMTGLSVQAAGAGNSPVQSISNEDHHSGSLGATWLLMGLAYRDRTGKSIALHTSLLGASFFVTSELIMNPDGSPLFRFELDKDQLGLGPLNRLYAAKDANKVDNWIAFVIEQDKEWRGLTKVPGLESLGGDSRFADRAARAKNADALAKALEAWFAARKAQDAVVALRTAGVPAAIVLPPQVMKVMHDDKYLANGRVAEYHHSQFGRMREAGLLMRFSETPGVIRRPSPLLGEHTREVLTQMGVSEAEQLALKDKKVVSWPG